MAGKQTNNHTQQRSEATQDQGKNAAALPVSETVRPATYNPKTDTTRQRTESLNDAGKKAGG